MGASCDWLAARHPVVHPRRPAVPRTVPLVVSLFSDWPTLTTVLQSSEFDATGKHIPYTINLLMHRISLWTRTTLCFYISRWPPTSLQHRLYTFLRSSPSVTCQEICFFNAPPSSQTGSKQGRRREERRGEGLRSQEQPERAMNSTKSSFNSGTNTTITKSNNIYRIIRAQTIAP